jgi:hypothetical protein
VTSHGWADPTVRAHIVELARAGWINAVQLDIKDEGGTVGYASTVPLAISSGAAAGLYDARAALDELHALDVRVIGRVVCFLDPKLAGCMVPSRWRPTTGMLHSRTSRTPRYGST